MNQSYQADPLMQNYLAPSYPIFIQIKFLISGLNAKKALKNAKSDIAHVDICLPSWPPALEQKEKGLFSPLFLKLSTSVSSRKSHKQALE